MKMGFTSLIVTTDIVVLPVFPKQYVFFQQHIEAHGGAL